MLQHSGIEEIPEWVEAERIQVEDAWIIRYKKVHYNAENSMLLTKLKFELVRNGQVEQTEMMDFPLRLYALDEFEHTLESNGFHPIVVHEVKDGYGEGTLFHVIECSKNKA